MGVFEGKYINIIKGIPSSWKKLPKVVGPKDEADVELNDEKCHTKQRQGLLQWAWNSTTAFTDEQREKNLKRMLKLTGTTIPEVSQENIPASFKR